MSEENASARRFPPRRWLWMMGGALSLLTVGAATGWALSTVLTPADEVLVATNHTYVSVEAGEVGSTIHLNAVAEWSPVPVGTNQASGIVTGVVVAPGDEVSQGSTIYTVNLRPVVVAQGEVPAFRTIELNDEGLDVAQLQAMLSARGFYTGQADGKAGPGTVRGIRAWQKSQGVTETGVVEIGDVIFVPTLPTRIALDGDVIFRGATVGGGEQVVRGLPAAPMFEVPVTESQAAMMPAGTRVEITTPEGGQWVAYVGAQSPDPDEGTVTVALGGEGGSVICGDQCGQVPVTGKALLESRIVTVETVAGLVVPSAALVSGADGQVAVIDDTGERLPVRVVAAARGMSIVEGVDAGVRVQIPAGSP